MDAPVVLSSAEQNAKAHLESVELWYEVYTWCQGNEDPNALSWPGRCFLVQEMDWNYDQDRESTADAIRERVQEDPLEVQVREDWHPIGEDAEMAEYCILISTGGPALRMIGRLEDYEPVSARLQHQDWGTNWTEYISPGSSDALIWYAIQFCWGE